MSDIRAPRGLAPVLARVWKAGLIVGVCAGIGWIVMVYADGLRDPRYLDGWLLAAGMGAQLLFHVARRLSRLSVKAAASWRSFHIVVGYVLIAIFAIHSDFTLPDSAFEWALWIGFVLVTLTGLLGTYMTWAQKSAARFDPNVRYERIPEMRAEVSRRVRQLVGSATPVGPDIGLPSLPNDAWIATFYSRHLAEYFEGRRNFVGHLIGSRRAVARLVEEIEDLMRYVDQNGQSKLAAIKTLVIEKDRLDCTSVYLGVTRVWLLVHVPATYMTVVMTILHIVVVYAFSSGAR